MKSHLATCLLIFKVLIYVVAKGPFPPTITTFPSNDNTLKKGEDYFMKCKDNSEPEAETLWFKDNIQIKFGTDDHVITNTNQDLIFLDPQPTKNNPTGTYTCHVKNQYGTTELGYQLKVTLAYFDDKFRYTPRDNFFYDIPGSNLAWANCLPPHSHPGIVASYINGSSGLPIDMTDTRITLRKLIRNGVYTQIIIENATKSDAGRWACVAKHPTLGTKKYEFNIDFYGPPPAAKNMRIDESRASSVVLAWDYLRNDLLIYDIEITKKSDDSKRSMQMEETKSPRLRQNLKFEVPGLEPGNDYSIRIRATDQKNQVGVWSQPFNFKSVDVLAPVKVEDPALETRVGEKLAVDISCRIDALPKPKFEWFKDGKKLEETADIIVNDGVLSLKNTKRGIEDGSEGMYKCKATNSHGSAESEEGKVVVEWLDDKFQVAPRTRFFYTTNKFIRISAQIPKGVEPIEVRWRKDTKSITKKTHPLFSPTLYRGPRGGLYHALDIRTPTIVQSDIYHLVAFNLAKFVSVEFRLIQAPPPLATSLTLSKTMHGAATVTWATPRTIERIQKLGYLERNDIERYDIWYRKESDTESDGTTVKHYQQEQEYRIIGLEIDVGYVARIRAVDFGDQKGAWSTFLRFKLDKDLPPAIITGPSKEDSAVENGTYSLPCEVSADKSVVITWYKDNKLIENTNAEYKVLGDGKLEMPQVKRSMTGSYHCQASTKFGTTKSDKGTFRTLFLDSTYVHLRKLTGVHRKAGFTDARVLCIPPLSYPAPVVLWTNKTGDKYLDFDENERITRDDEYVRDGVKYHSLVIKNAVELVGQEYGCAVYNRKVGTSVFYIKNTELTIYGKPDPPVLKYRFSPSKFIILEWTSDREDIVSFVITVKNGGTTVKTQTTSQKQHEFKDLSKSISYTFEVVAVDVASQKSDPGVITITETKPSIFKDLPSGQPEIFQGSEYNMECDFYGWPFPTIKWTRDGEDITDNVEYEFKNANRNLKIASISHSKHNGKYQCTASNSKGTAKSTVTDVKVIYTGKFFEFAGNDVSFINREGKNKVSFGCAPPPSYPPLDLSGNYLTWLVNGKPLRRVVKQSRVKEDGVDVDKIEFEAVPSDVGVYTCVYPHKAGNRRRDMKLTLKDGPRKPIGLRIKSISWNFFSMKWQHAGDVIKGYSIQVTQHSTVVSETTLDAKATEFTLNELLPLTPYLFSLSSIGAETNSLPVTLLLNTTKQPNIGSPSEILNIQKLNVGSTKATLMWDTPLDLANNHPNKLKYDVKICAGVVCWTPGKKQLTREITIDKLSPLTSYELEITVFNEFGLKGPVTKDFIKTLDGSTPPAISNFQANPSWNSIIVSWKKPHDTEISKISSYILRITKPGSTTPIDEAVSKDRTSYFFLNLKEGQEYKIGIFSKSNDRNGPLNSKTMKTTDLGQPGIPRVIRVDSKEDPNNANRISILFNWELPLELAGNPIDEIKYRIKFCDFNQDCEIKTTLLREMKFDNKKAGSTYKYTLTTLRADGADGDKHDGEFNSDIGKISSPIGPSQQRSLSPTDTIQISWSTPENLGGHHLNTISYKIDYCLKQGGIKYACKSQDESGTTAVLRLLSPGTNYYVSIRAKSQIGEFGVPIEIVTRTEGIPPKTTPLPTLKTDAPTTTKTTSTRNPNSDNPRGGGVGGKKETIVEEPLSTGVIIGIVLAVVVMAILVSAGVVMYMKKTKRGLHSTGQQKGVNYRQNQMVEVEMNRRKR